MEKYLTKLEAHEIFMEAFYLFKDMNKATEVLQEYKEILHN